MVGLSQGPRAARRRKRALLAAALCSASFFTGQMLFGDEPAVGAAAPSLLSQYLQAKSDLVPAPLPKPLEASAKKAPAETTKAKEEGKEPELIRRHPINAPVATAGKPTVTILPPPAETPANSVAVAPRERALEKLDSFDGSAADAVKGEAASAATLRPTAVSAAADLPFAPAQHSTPSAVRPAFAQSAPDTKSAVAPAIMAVPSANKEPPKQAAAVLPQPAAPVVRQPGIPAVIENPALPNTHSTEDEHLPPIVPAWAVPRPGAKKRAPQAANPQPAAAYPQTSASTSALMASAPALPLRIELGGAQAASPAVAPAAPQPPAPATPVSTNKRAEVNSLQRLPSVVALTPRPTPQQPAIGAKATSREPLLLPPVDAAQPIPLEIRNPHVAQASYQSAAPNVAPPAVARQHLDDE